MKLKLSSRKGFTITEILVTLLVISMVTMVVGGGVVVVKDAYTKITLKAEAETLRSTALTEVIDELRFAQNIEQQADPDEPDEMICVFDSQNRKYRMFFTSEEDGIYVNSYQSSGSKLPLLTKKTMTSDLIPKIEKLTYSSASGQFKLIIEVYTSAALKAGGSPLVTMDEITVKAINYEI